jgi:phage-related protein
VHKIIFYRDRSGNQPVLEYLQELTKRTDKDSRVKANKLNDYIQALSEYGTLAGVPYVKHLDGDIWELRPLRDRVLFAAWIDGSYVLLHHFMKSGRTTPRWEINKAKREFADFIERSKER